MKLKLTFLALIAFSLSCLNTQAQSFTKGDNVVNLTIGFGNTVYTGGTGYKNSPAFGLSGERCFFDELINGDFSVGIGAFLGYSTTKYETSGFGVGRTYGWRYTNFVIAGRGTFHWTGIEKLDTYVGVHIGGRIVSAKEIGDAPLGVSTTSESGGVYGAGFVGARYYFTENFSGVAEFGNGIGAVSVGVGLKF